MLVRESLSFSRGEDPKKSLDVGDDSVVVKKRIIKSLIEKGVTFFDFEKKFEHFIEHAKEINWFINKLVDVGIPYENIECNNVTSFSIATWIVLNSTYVLATFMTEEDAKIFVDVYSKFAIETYNSLTIEQRGKGSLSSHISPSENIMNVLYNIVENRKKYKSIIDG